MSGISEIQDTLEYLKNEVKKLSAPKQLMTREEAIIKCDKVGLHDTRNFLNALEALGLIKFAEPSKPNAYHEAVKYLNSGEGYRLWEVGKYHEIIKGLVDMINSRYADD